MHIMNFSINKSQNKVDVPYGAGQFLHGGPCLWGQLFIHVSLPRHLGKIHRYLHITYAITKYIYITPPVFFPSLPSLLRLPVAEATRAISQVQLYTKA